MGSSISSFIGSIFSKRRESKIVMLGLDSTGKTSMLYFMKDNKVVNTIPTVGFNFETVEFENVSFTVWDIAGGNNSVRGLWNNYFAVTDGLIWVVDSADRERLAEAKEMLGSVLKYEKLDNVPLLVLANKDDLEGKMSLEEISVGLGLEDQTEKRKWYI